MDSTIFFYGIDEFFINTCVLKFIEDKNIIYSYYFSNKDISHPLYLNYQTWNKFENPPDFLVKFYKGIFGNKYRSDQNLKENYEYLEKKYIYNPEKNERKIFEIFLKNLREQINKIGRDELIEKYKFSSDDIDCMECNIHYKTNELIYSYNDTESIENDDTIGDVRCIKNNTKICISHDDYHHPDDSLFVPKLLLYNKNFTNQQIIKRLINNKSLHMFKNYYNVEMLDSGLTKYKHYSLDSNNDMVLKGDHIDAIINKLKNMNNFIETVIALFKNLNVVFPQKKEDVKHDFCNENIYGNFNFIQIYGFLRME